MFNTYGQVFPGKDARWPQMQTLHLHRLAIGTKDMVNLLTKAIQYLHHLDIAMIELLDVRWEWNIELMQSMWLEPFNIQEYSILLYADGGIYGSPTYDDCFAEVYSELMDKGLQYANRGGRHLSLMKREDPAMSRRYLQELEVFLMAQKEPIAKLKARVVEVEEQIG